MTYSCSTDELRSKLDAALEIDPARGIYRGRRDVFTDPDIFELEMKHIFEGNWIYLAHESQMPNNGDYFTTYMGRQPVVITRDKNGELHCLINACSHRGAMLCRRKTDNRTTFTCPFHGWTFNNAGKLLKVKDPDGAGYPEQFNKDGSHDLTKVARFESYRGFLFGSLNPDVLPLKEHLGEATKIIDMIVDQSPEGLEVLRGSSTYTYDGNWKVQAENGADGYHVSRRALELRRHHRPAQHRRVGQRDQGAWTPAAGASRAAASTPSRTATCCCGPNGRNPEDRPLWDRRDELDAAVRRGQGATGWSTYSRNLCLYPNVYLMDQFSSQIRHFRPIAVDKTEVTIYCIAPKGESAEARAAPHPPVRGLLQRHAAWPRRTTWRSSAPAR